MSLFYLKACTPVKGPPEAPRDLAVEFPCEWVSATTSLAIKSTKEKKDGGWLLRKHVLARMTCAKPVIRRNFRRASGELSVPLYQNRLQ